LGEKNAKNESKRRSQEAFKITGSVEFLGKKLSQAISLQRSPQKKKKLAPVHACTFNK